MNRVMSVTSRLARQNGDQSPQSEPANYSDYTSKCLLPRAYWAVMRALLPLTLLIGLAACSGYDSAKQREMCQQAYPNDKTKVDACVAEGDRQAVADSWPWSKAKVR